MKSLLLLLVAVSASAAPLPLDGFLNSVKEKHEGYVGSKKISEAKKEYAEDAGSMLAPQLFANFKFLSDQKPTANPLMMGSKTTYNGYSIGVSKATRFGFSARLAYELNMTELEGTSRAFVPLPKYYEARPILEVSQSLWRNGFGSETRAMLDAEEGKILSEGYTEAFKAKMILMEAETTYWRLALARATVQVQKDSLARGKRMLDWATSRVRSDLADQADRLQAEAAYQLRQLELQAALDEERSAAAAFNSLRGVDGEQVGEELAPVSKETLVALSSPKRAAAREDFLAVEQGMRAQRAAAEIVLNRNLPTLDVAGSLALNARESGAGTSMNNSLKDDFPTASIGVKFIAPLDFSLASDHRAAARVEMEGADLAVKRKRYEEDRQWSELEKKTKEAQNQLELAVAIEKIQEQKLKHEKTRHERGRSTTFQVLQFEQEFAASQLNRIRAQAAILTLNAQMKTFGERS